MESLTHIRVIEVGGSSCGVGARGVHACLLPRTLQQCLETQTWGQSLCLPAPPTPQGESHVITHLMPHSLEWQASEEVAKILDHKSVLLISASEVCMWGMGAGPPDWAGVGPGGYTASLTSIHWAPPQHMGHRGCRC